MSKRQAKKVEAQRADGKGRVILFADFANCDVVVERVSADEVRVRMAKPRLKRIPLEKLLEGITPDNLHGEVRTSPAVGNEPW